jgi:hypothetical protein
MKNSRWSKEQEAVLLQTVQKASTTSKGIRIAARKLKRTNGSCAQRYYLLNNGMPSNKSTNRVLTLDGKIGKIRSINITPKGIDLVFNH